MRLPRTWLLVAAGLVGSSPSLSAQCADGSPPPCAGMRAAPRRSSVAVLPFENRSRDTTDAYLSDGLADAIIARLGRVERLAVTSQAAVRRLPNHAALNLPALGRALNASYLVSGTVQRTGQRLFVIAELVRPSSGERLWSDQYDRPAGELLEITSGIALGIAARLLGPLTGEERNRLAAPPTTSAAAFDLYLRGSRHIFDVDPTTLQDAIASFEAAVQRDPAFAAAHGRLAAAYSRVISFDVPLPGMTTEAVLARGSAAADRALATDSTSSDAWGGRGVMLFFQNEPDYAGAVAALRRATALDSTNAVLRAIYCQVLRRLGDLPTAEAQCRRALRDEPAFTVPYLDLALIAFTAHRPRDGLALLDSGLSLDSVQWVFHDVRVRVRLALGDTAGARSDAEAEARVAPPAFSRRVAISQVLVRARTGDLAGARFTLDSLLTVLPTAGPLNVRSFQLGQALVATGQPERAMDLLERIRPRGAWLWSFLVLPTFDPVRANHRFGRLIEEARPPGAPSLP